MLAKLYPYDSTAPQIFDMAKEKIQAGLPDAEIHHVGSTAVPGLSGKGMIDILVATPDWSGKSSAIEALKNIGYTHVNPEQYEYIFLSRVGETKKDDVHIHLTCLGSKEYKNLLAFRDYLLKHPEEVETYRKLKNEWLTKAKGDRKKYSSSKSTYISSLIQ